MTTVTTLSYRELVDMLEKNAHDEFDQRLLGCLQQIGPEDFESYLNRARAIAATIQTRKEHHKDVTERVITETADECEALLIQYLLVAQGVDENDMFNFLVFRRR